ncbi:MAG: GGDEF domain-containing protein [Pirellulaceae bacterium]
MIVRQLSKANEHIQEKLTEAESELAKISQQLELHVTDALTDSLTSLPNRRAFDREAIQALVNFHKTRRPLSLVMVDVDHFKTINDMYGHLTGDTVLRGIAQALRENFREGDFVARFGGEEFAVLLMCTPACAALRAAEAVREALQCCCLLSEVPDMRVTASLGVAELAENEELSSLLERADRAVYAAKNAGRNQVYWHDGKSLLPLLPTGDSPPECEVQSAKDPGPALTDPRLNCLQSRPSVGRVEGEGVLEIEGCSDGEFVQNLENRTMFCQRVRQSLTELRHEGPPFSIVLLRVDQFQNLQRTWGHLIAGTLFGAVAQTVQRSLRDIDRMAQYQDETLSLLLAETPLHDALGICARVRRAVRELAIRVEGEKVRLTVSLGVVGAAENEEMATLVNRATQELELAIQHGGDRISFPEALVGV